MTPMALENLAIAQHRDQLRYLRVRSADYQPQQKHFIPGQYVYVQQLQQYSTLQPKAQRLICQVVEVRDYRSSAPTWQVWQHNVNSHVTLHTLPSAKH